VATIHIEIPEEAAQIEGLGERIAWFVEEQIKIARWRKDRYSADVNNLVAAAYAEADRLRADGVSPQQARQEFSARWQTLGGE
jgi:hypothetical protein